jgi:hypothetical protein
MGATLSDIAFEYKALWIQAGVYFLTTCWVLPLANHYKQETCH